MKCFRCNFVPFFLQTSLKVGNSTGSSLSHFALQNAPHILYWRQVGTAGRPVKYPYPLPPQPGLCNVCRMWFFTFQKKLGQEQFRASNEVNWLNNDVIWNRWCQQVIVIMIWYKSSIQERSSPLGAKMCRGSPVCQQIREKIIEMFKNNVPQRKMGRDLDISPSTVHNIIKRFKESGGISVRKGQGRKPKLNNRDLRSLRRHCIKNRHSSISDITTWAQDYFGKPLSSTTIRSYIHKCQLKLYCAKRKPYVNSVQKRRRLLWARRHLGWTITQWKRVLWSDESVFQVFFGRNGRRVLRTKEEKDHPDCYQQQVQKPGSVMVWGCVSALGKGNLHFCDGTINAEKYIEILEHNMLPSRRHLFQGRPCIFQQDNAKPVRAWLWNTNTQFYAGFSIISQSWSQSILFLLQMLTWYNQIK